MALGDFAASNDSAELLPIDAERGDAARTVLEFPPTTRALEARLDTGRSSFSGYGERSPSERFDVLLWPERQTCSVFRPDADQGYPGKGGGQALGFARERGLFVAAGGNHALVSDTTVGALSFDVMTGDVASFDRSQDALLREARAFASMSELGDKLLIAGGQYPVFGLDEEHLDLRATAEIFDPALGTLAGAPIALRTARTRHAAVTLRSGATLLLGGRGKTNDQHFDRLAAELISPETLLSKPTVTPAARVDPRALVLSDGRVFVGGGTTGLDVPASPAGEWISSDGLMLLNETDIPLRFGRAFVATEGGGVLAVGGCEDREPESKEEAVECELECERGCRPLAAGGRKAYDAYWLDPEGVAHELSLGPIMAGRPILLPGSDGRPWLVAEREGQRGTPRLFRFDPWLQRFDEVDVPEGLRLPRPDYPQPVAIGPDAFVWLDDDGNRGELLGLRLGTRNRYARDLALVLLFDPDEPARPLHLAPDRPLRDPERYDGKLWLYPRDEDEPPLTVSVTDTDYADVRVTLRLAPANEQLDVPSSQPPIVLLGGVQLGGDHCPWPAGRKTGAEFDQPRVLRRGGQVELRLHGGVTTCSVPAGRLKLGLRAQRDVAVIEQLDVVRGATAF